MDSSRKDYAPRWIGDALAAAEWVLLATLFVIFVVRGLVPGWRVLNTDFPNYYLTASLRREGTPVDRAYEWIWFQREKDHRAISQPLVGFVPNPPLCAAPLLPIASFPALSAKRVWILLNLVLLAATLFMLHGVTRLSWRRILLIMALCVVPLRTNFNYGQYYVVILFLICLAYYAFVRGHRFTAGGALAAAAWFKLFPAVFLFLFLRKREWRAITGLLAGLATLGVVSVLFFGLDVHRIWLFEVLPRALRGDLVGPYALEWSSFTSLWHRLFLFEPELNPVPLINSVWLYAIAQALTGTALLFAFLLSTGDSSDERLIAWEWSAFVPLLLLLSSMPGPYHYCVLIFSTILGIDFFLQTGRWRVALLVGFFYAVACIPNLHGFVLQRVFGTFALYMVLLGYASAKPPSTTRKTLLTIAAAMFLVLVGFNLNPLRDRAQDFSRRLPYTGWSYASFNPVATPQGVISVEMVNGGYEAVSLLHKQALPMPTAGDVLALAASAQSPLIYFELTDQRSRILRLASDQIGRPGAMPEFVAEGQQPAISNDGHWLAFLRTQDGGHHHESVVWLSHDGAPPQLAPGGQLLPDILEMTVTDRGDIIVAIGGSVHPRLIWLHKSTGTAEPLRIAGAVRYPAISPDSTMLAFARRDSGSWHLFVRELSTGSERQLTTSACNATSPVWQDSHTLLYATDCGRGLGLSAVARFGLDWRVKNARGSQ